MRMRLFVCRHSNMYINEYSKIDMRAYIPVPLGAVYDIVAQGVSRAHGPRHVVAVATVVDDGHGVKQNAISYKSVVERKCFLSTGLEYVGITQDAITGIS